MQKKYSLGRYCQLHIPICFPVGVTSRYNRRGMHWNLQVFTSIRGMRERNKGYQLNALVVLGHVDHEQRVSLNWQ